MRKPCNQYHVIVVQLLYISLNISRLHQLIFLWTETMSSSNVKNVEELRDLLSRDWLNAIGEEFSKPYWQKIVTTLNGCRYLPEKRDIFNALNSCPPHKVKAVIIGQDPYINSSEAHGFSFSVKPNVKIPPSLRNIFKELQSEYNQKDIPTSGCLTAWANEGVLLLNSILTVKIGESNSHAGIGWENFTSTIIKYIDAHNTAVFMAWGSKAQKICFDNVKHNTILTAGHPSPLNRTNPFVGCNCFHECNEILMKNNILPIRWLRVWNP